MDFDAFKLARLRAMAKEELVNIVMHPLNSALFGGIYRRDAEGATQPALIDIIMRTPDAFIDSNLQQDFRHEPRRVTFDILRDRLDQMRVKRQQDLAGLRVDQLQAIILHPSNSTYFPGYRQDTIAGYTREALIRLISINPGVTLTGNPADMSFDPGKWVPKPNQVEHIQRMSAGLMNPNNESRCVWDGSDTGLGKTASAILTAINLKVRFMLVICPKSMVKKWNDALRPLGLFNYRLTTYAGVTGARGSGTRWSKYKTNPDDPDDGDDNDWLQIRPSGKTGKNKNIYDWSFLPDNEPGFELGGCLVVWDEVQNAKAGGASLIGNCFDQFIQYLKSEPIKYVRSLLLSAGIMEKVEDLPYIMYALGYITDNNKRSLNKFMSSELGSRFRDVIGDDWKPGYQMISDSKRRLLIYLRVVAQRQLRFSQIPRPLPYILHKLKYIPSPELPEMNEFITKTLLPNFQRLMEADWREEYETRDPKAKLLLFLSHLSTKPINRNLDIDKIVNSSFVNPITFQGMKIRDEDIDQFIAINREIQMMLLEMVKNEGRRDIGAMGRIQKILSKLEVLKLTPFTELAVRTLNEATPNGGKPSVIISMIRNKSVRYFAWRLEAVLWIQHLQTLNPTEEQLYNIREQHVNAILREYERYLQTEALAIEHGNRLQLKKAFERYSRTQLNSMSWVDLVFEYNKWIKYLDVNAFEHVCIYVADFGDKNDTDFDLSSADQDDWIRESKVVKSDVRERMKSLFQSNTRRVFLTNMFIAREGIDLHDTSDGGMHPRTMIISPGIVARYLLQMLGRVVREGQSSESLRLVGFIDDVQGIRSWEALFMQKMSDKVKDIELLHSGEISLDIEENIDKDGQSVFKSVLDDLKSGRIAIDSQSAPITRPAIAGEMFQQAPKKSPGTTIMPGKGIPVGDRPSVVTVAQPVFLDMRTTRDFIYFDTSSFAFNEENAITNAILEILGRINLDPRYYARVALVETNRYGVLIYRPGFLVAALSQTNMLAQVESSTGYKVKQYEETFDDVVQAMVAAGFKPLVVIDQLVIMFQSSTGLYVQPRYPIESMIPEKLFGDSLRKEDSGPRSMLLKLVGTGPKIMLAFYAIRAAALFHAPESFTNFVLQDPAGIVGQLDPRFIIRNYMMDGEFRIMGYDEIIRGMPYVISAVPGMMTALTSGQIFQKGSTREEENGTMLSARVLPAYYDFFTKLLFNEPVVYEKKK